MYRSGKKPSKLRIQKQSEEKIIIKNRRSLFKPKKENEAIKDRIIREIKILFEQQQEDYYKTIRIFGIIIISNSKVAVLEVKPYQ